MTQSQLRNKAQISNYLRLAVNPRLGDRRILDSTVPVSDANCHGGLRFLYLMVPNPEDSRLGTALAAVADNDQSTTEWSPIHNLTHMPAATCTRTMAFKRP